MCSAAGAAATLDTLAKGQRPPEPEVATIPRGGTVLHQRVAVLFGDGSPAPGWSAVPASPRADMTPELNAWIGRMLGPPDGYACVATPEGEGPHIVTLADVGLQPVDLVLTMQATGDEGAHTELDLRVAWVVAGATGSDPTLTESQQMVVRGDALQCPGQRVPRERHKHRRAGTGSSGSNRCHSSSVSTASITTRVSMSSPGNTRRHADSF